MKVIQFEIEPHHPAYTDKENKSVSAEEGLSLAVYETEDGDDVTLDLAAASLDLMAKTYANQFESRRNRIPAGTFRRYFDSTDSAKVRTRRERMRGYIESYGSIYGFVLDPVNQNRQIGLVKASPSKANRLQKLRLKSPNAYLNDIVVDPEYQGHRIGSLLVYAALRSDHFDQRRSLTLDGFTGNEAPNRWFWRLGLDKTGAEVSPLVIDEKRDLVLPAERYTSEGRATLKDINIKLGNRAGIS